MAHDPSYPTADALRSVTCIGNVKMTGCMDEDTPGSELIRRRILADDPRPLYLLGCNSDMMAGCWWGHAPHERYDMISEGDSPSLLYLIDKGLRSLEDPTFGGWGGRFVRKRDNEFNTAADYWCSATDACEPPMKPEAWQITRWAADWLSDFASRASWCVTPHYEDANHTPEVAIAEGLDLAAAPGERLALHAEATDPDGDTVQLSRFRCADADTCAADVPLRADGTLCELAVPADARPGDTIHLVCRTSDEGNGRDTYMVSYARAIITVAASEG